MPVQPLEKKAVVSSFIHFDSGLKKTSTDYYIERAKSGLINQTYFLTCKPNREKYVVRKLNGIFNWRAINNNLKLLEKAQKIINKNVPKYWQPADYLNVLGESDKVYFDDQGDRWVVMKYIPGNIRVFENFGQVTIKDRGEIAYSFGEALKIFQNILSTVPLKNWQQSLPNFHDAKYHYDYLRSILDGKRISLSLSSDASRKVNMQNKFLNKYKSRIDMLLSKVEKQKKLASDFKKFESGVVHGDPKINNAIFSKDSMGRWHCISLVDLDTVQIEPIINDLGDALRSSGNPAGEQPSSLDLIKIDKQVVLGITDGYINKTKQIEGIRKAKKIEKYASKIYAHFLYMLGIRFLADSLVGNKYFKLKENEPEDLNLYRAEVQFNALDKILLQ